MKLDTHAIRFRFWLAFFLLAIGITVFIGTLQTGLIRPYYRNTKVQSVSSVADRMQDDLVSDSSTSQSVQQALREAVDNSVCVVMYNDKGTLIYNADSLGAGCIFNNSGNEEISKITSEEGMKTLLTDTQREYTANFTNEATGQEMIVYGRKISETLGNYYMFINSPLEPVDSVVTFFQRQYAYYTMIAIVIASLVAFYISTSVTGPIVRMKKEASKLSNADYSTDFDGGAYTETRELANTLNLASDKLGRVDELRRDLIANVSHDIRTPLTDIRAYAEMIRDVSGDNPEKRKKHLNVIIRETDYMNRLVNDMSELAKMQSGNYELNRENFDICDAIRDIVDMDESLIKNAGVNLITEIPESLTVYADEIKISQVIANYLSNAIKHTPKGGTIYIRALLRDDGETVRIEVEDEGEGIDEKDLPNIWDRYQKSSHSFSRSMTSTGLGLAIVRGIAEAHGAGYGVVSEKGKGSTFWLELRETHEA
ncbi:MAG: HAMP domain-containing sensor histidine kinase [Erysipelotrichaceae bacterium]|nr:HAMP domain-containing sensor histidine kinase [Erysipelotrichaceae bacterium]